ncbi:MAG: HAD family phosphatase [Candidatus Marinimicrobia bacterium]|jgi:putative hydrolase of the HAD superfamily|nr:HAD family phosphatase [Candidatus Neomarinimicrobiota bacterium]MDP6835858.1 HAD family phosphatase [Candidatus Neomarinimicrobiota bacterium]|tara:strand:- start:6480 stop:7082 length:603 start_codon:yes stop_codon:yes gene_type:complete
MIKTIFMDIGGVLLDISPERTLAELITATDHPESVIREAFHEDALDRYEKGQIGDDQFYAHFRDALPEPDGLTKDKFFSAWLTLLGTCTDSLSVARDLVREYPVWLASNTNPFHIRHGTEKGWLDGFSGYIYSFEISARKPHADFFTKALTLAGAEARTSLFIDDHRENVETADKLGFTTIHYRSHEQFCRDLSHHLDRI